MQANNPICQKCKLPQAPKERLGSFTSFVFKDLHCQCHTGNRPVAKEGPIQKVGSNNCKTCGKPIPTVSRVGSITNFLLKDLRCSCERPLPVNNENVLETRFKPASATMVRKREAMQTQMRTRSSSLAASDALLVQLRPGEIIGGCYQLADLVGQGGMGQIYKARHVTLNRTVALKFIAPSLVSKESWELFKREAKLSSTLIHSTICQIYDLGLHAHVLPFYAMDFIEGNTLEEILVTNGPLSVGSTLEVFIKVADGLSYAHGRSIVHKDIKPANIMIVNDSHGLQVKILDFGIAELNEGRRGQSQNDFSMIVGSASYMSPEQFRGTGLDHRSDIYSIGCAMYEALTGAPPFTGESYEALSRSHQSRPAPLLSDATGMDFTMELEAIIQKCLRKRPEMRYQSAGELILDLQRLLDGKEIQFAKSQLAEMQATVPIKEKPDLTKQLLIAGGLIVALSLPVMFFFWQQAQAPSKKSITAKPSAVFKLRSAGDLMPENDAVQTFSPTKTRSLFEAGSETMPEEFFTGQSENSKHVMEAHYSFPSRPGGALARFVISKGPLNIFDILVQKQTHFQGSKHNDAGVRTVVKTRLDERYCYGKMTVPLERFKTLSFDVDAIFNTSFVKGIRIQDVQGLDFTQLNGDYSNLLNAAITRFPDVERILFCDLSIFQPPLADLAQMRNLKELVLIDWFFTDRGQPLTSADDFKHLQTLYLNTYSPLKDVLNYYFAHSPLQTVTFEDATVEPVDITQLKNYKTLDALNLKDCRLRALCLKDLHQVETLKSLTIYTNDIAALEVNLKAMKAPDSLDALTVFTNQPMPESIKNFFVTLEFNTIKTYWAPPPGKGKKMTP